MNVRLDKWLHVARAFKTRARATRACNLGNVQVNGQIAKPHRRLAVDDEITIDIGDWQRVLRVKVLKNRSVRKADAADLYDDRSPPRPERDPFDATHAAPGARPPGAGRPTKRDRRDLERWRRS